VSAWPSWFGWVPGGGECLRCIEEFPGGDESPAARFVIGWSYFRFDVPLGLVSGGIYCCDKVASLGGEALRVGAADRPQNRARDGPERLRGASRIAQWGVGLTRVHLSRVVVAGVIAECVGRCSEVQLPSPSTAQLLGSLGYIRRTQTFTVGIALCLWRGQPGILRGTVVSAFVIAQGSR